MTEYPSILTSDPVVMEWTKISRTYRLPLGTVMETYRDPGAPLEEVVARFSAEVLSDRLAGDRHSEVVTHQWGFPSSPWQFFKQRHATSWWLGWLVRRRPVRLQTCTRSTEVVWTLERRNTYPESRYMPPPPKYLGKPVLVERVDVERFPL